MQRELLLLREVRDAAVSIRDLIGGRSAEELEADELRRSALLWHFTVLGEAASKVPVETKDAHPQIAWSAATRLRNRIVHGYWARPLRAEEMDAGGPCSASRHRR